MQIVNSELNEKLGQLTSINSEIKHFLQLTFNAPNKQFRLETIKIVKKLFIDRKKLKIEIKI